MSEYTEDLFARCWIIWKTKHPRQAIAMNLVEAEVLGISPKEEPKKENDKDGKSETEPTGINPV